MKKRILAAALAVCLFCSVLGPTVSAASTNAALQTVRSLGVITADASGDLQLNASVTRAQFAQMLVTLSGKTAGSTSGTLFTDVSSSSSAAGAIRLAVQEGWMSGYADGTFRPNKTITLEEACTAALRVLGYDTAKLSGSFPAAQLEKASALGLRQDITLTQGQGMTRAACVSLLYNMLLADTANGGTYATTLGYSMTGGEVDYTAATLQGLSGPYIAQSGTTLPFTPSVIYRDGKSSASATLQKYDVYYYNAAQKAVWIYTKRIAGRVSTLSPNAKAPTSVWVAGRSYELASANAVYQLSVLSGGGEGSVVTLLLGMDDEVVGVLTGSQVNTTYYGVVQTVGRSVGTDDGGAQVLQSMEVLCTDGILHTFEVDEALLYPEGWIVEVDVTEQGVAVQPLANTVTGTSLSGRVDAGATTLGQYAFADNIKILDTTSEGAGVILQPNRLAGYTLSANDVRYYSLDEEGKIDHLILNDVTGDVWTYGYLTNVGLNLDATPQETSFTQQVWSWLQSLFGGNVEEQSTQINLVGNLLTSVEHGSIASDLWGTLTGGVLDLGSAAVSTALAAASSGVGGSSNPVGYLLGVLANGAQYTYIVDGKTQSVASSVPYSVVAGGVAVRYSTSGTVKAMLQTTPIVVEQMGANTVTAGGKTYTLADDVQVYLYKYGEYYDVALSDVNADDYILTGWYDDFGCTAGGRVRILVAVRK